MNIHENKRRDFHKAYQSGLKPHQIGEKFGYSEMDVVLTLRHPSPKIRGANYKGLKVPVPVDEVVEAFYNNSLDQLANKYHLSRATLIKRLPEELRTGPGRPKIKKHDKLSIEEKNDIINRYYRSARKLNACGVSSHIAKAVLTESNIPLKNSKPVQKRYQVALLDCLICSHNENKIDSQELLVASRILYELTTDNPKVWKGQLLDWFLVGRLNKPLMVCINKAIDDVLNLKGYEEDGCANM